MVHIKKKLTTKKKWEISSLAEELCDLLKLCYCAVCSNFSILSIGCSQAGKSRDVIKLGIQPIWKNCIWCEFFHQDEHNVSQTFFFCGTDILAFDFNGYLNPLIHKYGAIQILHFTFTYYLEYIYKDILSLIYYLITDQQVKFFYFYLFPV